MFSFADVVPVRFRKALDEFRTAGPLGQTFLGDFSLYKCVFFSLFGKNTKREAIFFMDKLVIEGINHKGFGTIPKAIMLWPPHDLVDENGTVVAKGLHNTAKAICGYILCYSGGGSTSFHGRDKICNDLWDKQRYIYKVQKAARRSWCSSKKQGFPYTDTGVATI